MIDYRDFRFSRINDPRFCHLKLLLFWPVYGLLFFTLEHITLDYNYIHCTLDDFIPFNEFFAIPYYFWFAYLVGIMLYGLLFDIKCFTVFMKMMIFTCIPTCIIYFIYPSAQDLRPEEFLRDNIFTDIIKRLYAFDTNTNVCPSIHVTGAVSVSIAAWNSKHFKKVPARIAFSIITVLICLSTVFLKQHSALDIFWGVVLCTIAYSVIKIYEKQPAMALKRKKIKR